MPKNVISLFGFGARVSRVLSRLGIETRLQLAITICVASLIIVTTLGGSGGAPWVFFTYRTLLVVIAILCVVGLPETELVVSRRYLACTGILFTLMLISVLRIPGSHFEAFYLWYKYLFFAAAFISLANYARYQSARWRWLVLGTIVTVNLVHLLPDLVRNNGLVMGFSRNNANYFATYLLIAVAVSIAATVFTTSASSWRIAAAIVGFLLLFGIVKTASRGGALAVIGMMIVAAVRARGRIPRQVWLAVALAGLVAAVVTSPYLISKFVDRGVVDPYNYARTEIWKGAVQLIADHPILGVGFGQFFHISKRYTLPIQGPVARYMKRAQMAHNEYLQHIGEIGLPAALLLFSLLGYSLYQSLKRANAAWPEFRGFHEAALFTAVGIGIHALVDNCWTIPVTASSLVVLAMADPLPLTKKTTAPARWSKPLLALAGGAVMAFYVLSTAIPGLGLYYNDRGHKAYDRDDFVNAERDHLTAILIAPDHPVFLDNLGMVYLQQFTQKRDPQLLTNAKEYFRRAIEAAPNSIDPHIHMETVLVRSLSGDRALDAALNQDIIRVDTELLKIDPFIPFARKNLASALYNQGQVDHAMLELRKAIEYEPNYVPGYLQLAAWYSEHGDGAAGNLHNAAAMSIINKYRNFKPTEPYEGILLGRPEQSWIALTDPKR